MNAITKDINNLFINASKPVTEIKVNTSGCTFQKFNKFITVTQREAYTRHYNAILKYFIKDFKNDKLFKLFYSGHDLSGSYADGLKVSKPNEFDTVINFKLVKNNKGVVLERDKPGYVRINVNNCEFHDKELINDLIDEQGYVLQCKTLVWMNKLVQSSLKTIKTKEVNSSDNKIYNLKIDNDEYKIRYSTSGPALTLKVEVVNTEIKLDMDLVPVYFFSAKQFWVSDRELPTTTPNPHWLAMPKPSKDVVKNNRAFICSYLALERDIINRKRNFKILIRIFKKLRDTQHLTNLKSYYIKVIFLHHLDEVKSEKYYWDQPISVLFGIMLYKIMTHLKKESLPYYWDKSYNMFGTLKTQQIQPMLDTFHGLQKKLDKTDGVIKMILTGDERKQMVSTNDCYS